MPESDAMSPEEPITKSLLDKPLHQLTEEDIAQLTREDCRRYLKEKGMRRPSWNKSQAIQQVISLKALLETTSDSDAASTRKKLHVPRPDFPHRVPKETNADTQILVSAEQSIPHRRKDPDSTRLSSSYGGPLSPRNTGATNGSLGQMAIFYCGKVNVYDDVPADKARAIMQLAASSLYLPSYDRTATTQSLECHLPCTSVKEGQDSPLVVLPTIQTVKMIDNSRLPREENSIFHEDNLGLNLEQWI